jgi:hypothetical protein
MLKQTDQQWDQDAGLDSAIARLRHQLGVFKKFLTGEDFFSSLAEVDREKVRGSEDRSSVEAGEPRAHRPISI